MKRILSLKIETDMGNVLETKLHQKTVKEGKGCCLDLIPLETVKRVKDMVDAKYKKLKKRVNDESKTKTSV